MRSCMTGVPAGNHPRKQKNIKVLLDFFLVGLPTARVSAVLAGPFAPCLRCGFLPYIQYGCEPTPWPDAKFLGDHSCQRTACSPKSRSPEAEPLVAPRTGRNTRPSQRAKPPRRARRELPHRPKAPSADGAIPAAYAARPPSPPLTGWWTAAFPFPPNHEQTTVPLVGRDLRVPPLVRTIDHPGRRGRHP